jgi:hypothetical protein
MFSIPFSSAVQFRRSGGGAKKFHQRNSVNISGAKISKLIKFHQRNSVNISGAKIPKLIKFQQPNSVNISGAKIP